MAKDNNLDELTVMLADRIFLHVRDSLKRDSYMTAFYTSMLEFMPTDLPPEVSEEDRDLFWEAQICKQAARFLIYSVEQGNLEEAHLFNEAFPDKGDKND